MDENYRAGGLGQAVNGFLKEGKEMYKAKEAYQSIDKTDENADALKDLLDKNPETWEFVKNYSKMKRCFSGRYDRGSGCRRDSAPVTVG